MENFKDRLYNFESTPPKEIWDNISAELDGKQTGPAITGLRRRSKFLFYGLTAAASLAIIFISSVLFKKSEENTTVQSSLRPSNPIAQKVIDSLKLNKKTLDAIINSSKDKDQLAKNYENQETKVKKYITISGPDCEPVKISPKVATLIESTDNEYPPRAVWNKKIEKWKQIMLSTTFSPTSTSLLDIAQLPTTVEDNNE